MKVKVIAIVIIDTDTVKDKHNKLALEKLAWNKGGDNLDKLWAWDEAKKLIGAPNVSVELL